MRRRDEEKMKTKRSKKEKTKEDVIVVRALYANLQTRRFEKDVPDNMENVELSR